MKADYAGTENAVEIASYIVRPTENANADQKNNKAKNKKKYIFTAGIPMLVLVLVSGLYGIGKKAAAYEIEEIPATQAVITAEAESISQNTAEENRTVTVKAEETERITGSEENIPAMQIPSGTEVLDLVAKQEVSTTYEKNISGLLWNYELISDIQRRAEAAKAEAEQLEEEYRELLVTMGIGDGYTSEDPELPEYLTKSYNPQMDIELSDEEISELLRLVEAEAPAEDIYGKILVANVVLNRVNHEKMADTVTGVIYEKIGGNAQFSPTVISWYWNSIVVTDSTREAVARCLSGEDYSNGALYFYAWERNPDKHKTSEWMRELECLFTHGGHRFFR